MEAEKESLQAALDTRDKQLREEARKNAGLVTDLEKASTEVERLDEEVERQSRLAVDLITTVKQERAAFEFTLEEKKAELVSALVKQKVDLEEKFQAEFDVAYNEGIQEVTAEYKVQMHKIRERAWELGWRVALIKVGVSEDDPSFRYLPKFQSSDPVSSSIPSSSSTPNPSFEAPPGVDVAIEVVALQANPKACPTNPKACSADLEACPEPRLHRRRSTATLKLLRFEFFFFCISFLMM